MTTINENYLNLKESYLFSLVAKKMREYSAENPDKKVIRMDIGDVTLPLPEAVISAMHRAVDEMGDSATFKGYGPEQGYPFFKQAIAGYYAANGVMLDDDEIFACDGAKSDLGNILDILGRGNRVMIPSPVYPVYVDTNIMDGREITFLPATFENSFTPLPPEGEKADIIYICSPNNPTGAVYTREKLRAWVDYARQNGSLILFDAAYEAFVTDRSLPRSIFEIDGAKECAVEFCSFSKTAGFTGVRCGYTVVPSALRFGGASLNKLWLRRQTTKFNGVSYIVQRGAQAVFSPEGQAQIGKNLDYYRRNARVISDALGKLSIKHCGGENSPYIWLECPFGMDSWEFFDYLLRSASVSGTPGEGFGEFGKGFFRLTAFSSFENTVEAMERFKKAIERS